jgi:hypothetical protein
MSTVVFWVLRPCSLLGGYQRFGGTLVTTYKTTRRHNPVDHSRRPLLLSNFHRSWNVSANFSKALNRLSKSTILRSAVLEL